MKTNKYNARFLLIKFLVEYEYPRFKDYIIDYKRKIISKRINKKTIKEIIRWEY